MLNATLDTYLKSSTSKQVVRSRDLELLPVFARLPKDVAQAGGLTAQSTDTSVPACNFPQSVTSTLDATIGAAPRFNRRSLFDSAEPPQRLREFLHSALDGAGYSSTQRSRTRTD